MEFYHLAIAYKWIYDKDLVEGIESFFQSKGLKTYVIHESNYSEVEKLLVENKLRFKAYLDRASDEDEHFEGIAKILTRRKTIIVNPYKKVENAVDKSVMHKLLLRNDIPTPKTIILPPIEDNDSIDENKIAGLGIPFVIKPAYYSGGSDGVYLYASTIEEIQKARIENEDDHYLIQEKIFPQTYDGELVWFRVYWFFDQVIIVWWNDETHIYRTIKNDEYNLLNLQKMEDIVTKIASISGMNYFSSELTIDRNGNIFVIDYVNDQCDFRKKSAHFDGVPDEIVNIFIQKLFDTVNNL